jgi:hypothetical protein
MRRLDERTNPALTATFTVASSLYAVIVATGVLTITLSVIAWANGTSFVEYYQYIFPRLRGGAATLRTPPLGYAAFVRYVSVAVLLAIHTRRRFEAAWSRRRESR